MTNNFDTQAVPIYRKEHDYQVHPKTLTRVIAMSKRRGCVEGEEACLTTRQAISIFQRNRKQRDCFVSYPTKITLFPRNDVITLMLMKS